MLKDKQIFIFDLDGTVYKGTEVIPGASRVIRELQKLGKQVILLTNNATQSRASFVEKLSKMDIHVSEEQIISSGYIASLSFSSNIRNLYGICDRYQ